MEQVMYKAVLHDEFDNECDTEPTASLAGAVADGLLNMKRDFRVVGFVVVHEDDSPLSSYEEQNASEILQRFTEIVEGER